MAEFAAWNSFYVIVGSAAGALIGLQFVVMTLLIADMQRLRTPEAGAAFATPSVVHFGVVLLLSAVASAPWQALSAVVVVWGCVGLSGIVYAVVVTRRLSRQTAYRPVFEDWLFYVLLPFAAYAILTGSSFAARPYTRLSLFTVGAAALMLLFVGIRNAWDTVTHLVFVRDRIQREDKQNH